MKHAKSLTMRLLFGAFAPLAGRGLKQLDWLHTERGLGLSPRSRGAD